MFTTSKPSRRTAVLFTAALLSVFFVTNAMVSARADSRVFKKTLRSTAWIVARVQDEFSTGTGVVIDREKKLVVTNGHVVQTATEAMILFPQFQEGRLVAEKNYYADRLRELSVVGKVVAVDKTRDLALLELSSLPEDVVEMNLSESGLGPGDVVHSIGNPSVSGGLWAYTQGTVRTAYRKQFSTQAGPHDMRVLETQSPINPGDSGGPVVDGEGRLVGITHSLDREARLMSYCIDVSELRSFLAEDHETPVQPEWKSEGSLVLQSKGDWFGK